MTTYLRQSTASQEVTLGPFVDSTDANSEEVALTIANTDVLLHKHGGTTLPTKNSGGGTHISNGIYYIVLDATDTNTIGNLDIYCHMSGALWVKKACVVLDEAVYDALFGTVALATATNITAAAGIAVSSIGAGAITAAAIATGAIDADALAADAAAEIADAVWDEDATAHQTTGTFGQAIGDPVADTNTIYGAVVTGAAGATVAADIIAVKADTAAILADTGTDGVVVAAASKTGYALSAAGVQAIWDALTSALTTVGSIGKLLVDNINATISSRSSHAAADVWSVATRVLTAATNITSTGGTTVPQTGDSFARLGAPAGVSVSADVAAVKSDTAAILTDTGTTLDTAVTAIKTQTDKLTFTVANQVDSNIQYVNDVLVTGDGQAGTEWGP